MVIYQFDSFRNNTKSPSLELVAFVSINQMKGLLVVLVLAACLVHLNEGFYYANGKRSVMKVCL